MRVASWPVVGTTFAVLWLFVRGVEPTPHSIVGQLLLGLAIGLPVAYVFRGLYAPAVDLRRLVRGAPYAVLYVVAFGIELIRANLDVAYRALAPGMPIEPEVLLVPLRVRSDVAVTVIANSITITPGTVTLDYDEETNALYVHVIDGRDPGSVVATIRTWEDYALEIFAEERPSAEPTPDYVVTGVPEDLVVGVPEDSVSGDGVSGVPGGPDHGGNPDGGGGRRGA